MTDRDQLQFNVPTTGSRHLNGVDRDRSGPVARRARARFQWRHINDAVERELTRIFQIWETCLARYGADGPWLFGKFSIADAMYAPVCLRLDRYNVPVSDTVKAYVNQTLALPSMQEWCAAAYEEKEVIGWAENSELMRIEE